MTKPIELSGAAFDSLDAMMRAHAETAVRIAAADHGMVLDYSADSIPRLETVVAARGPVPDADLEDATRLWGAYFGEAFRHRYPAEWIMAVYPTPQNAGRRDPGSDLAIPALDIRGSHVYPLLKLFRRITIGPSEDLTGFYTRVCAALDSHKPKSSS